MPAPSSTETIAAISTPPGRGGIGVLRLAGPDAIAITGKLVRLTRPLVHAQARFAQVLDPQAGRDVTPAVIDEAVVTAFVAPRSIRAMTWWRSQPMDRR